MSDAQLKIDSSNIEKTTIAVDNLVKQLEELSKAIPKTEEKTGKLDATQRRAKTAVTNSNAAATKQVALLNLQRKGLDGNSRAYANQKAKILAAEIATKKGIKTGTAEYRALVRATKQKEQAAAASRRLNRANVHGSRSTEEFVSSLERATQQVRLIDGPLGGVASRMTALTGIMRGGALGFAALGVSAALGFREIYKGINTAADTEVAMRSFEAQLQATGGTAGFTAKELDGLSRSLAMGTLDSTEDMRKLTGVMLTFKNVTGDALLTAIGLSQDFGKAMRQDPVTAARMLGRVLENPMKNYKKLARAGIEFAKDEADKIKRLQQEGKLREAQLIITDKLEGKFGGLAAAQADALRGDVDTYNQKWEELAETIGSRLVPATRTLVQVTNSAIDVLQGFVSTDVEIGVKKWEAGFNSISKNLPALEEELLKVKKGLKDTGEPTFLDNLLGSLSTGVGGSLIPKTWFDNRDIAAAKEVVLLKAIEARKLKGQGEISNPELDKYIEDTELKVSTEKRLTTAFLKYGDTRSEGYRKEKAEVDALRLAKGLGIEGSKDELKVVGDLLTSISDLTEQRVKYNSFIQLQKAGKTKSVQAEKEIALNDLITRGLTKNSEEYIRSSLVIDARNKARKAGLADGSAESDQLIKEAEALAVKRSELAKISILEGLGGQRSPETEGVFSSGSALAAEANYFQSLRDLRSLNIEDEIGYQDILRSIQTRYAEEKSSLLGINFAFNKENRLVAISEMEAIEAEKNERLRVLDEEMKLDAFSSEEAYLIRRNALIADYDKRQAESAQKSFEATTAHKDRLRSMEVAGGVAAIATELSNVKKGNKALARIAKAASIFKASTALVDALSNASALPYPANISAYIQAGVQGAQLISMASSTAIPSFAFGGVDIQGAGTGRSDNINAKIASGESVMTQSATSRHKDTLKRMNQGLTVGSSGQSISIGRSTIVIQGDASESTVALIDQRLTQSEERFREIARGASIEVLQEENEVGGLLDPI